MRKKGKSCTETLIHSKNNTSVAQLVGMKTKGLIRENLHPFIIYEYMIYEYMNI